MIGVGNHPDSSKVAKLAKFWGFWLHVHAMQHSLCWATFLRVQNFPKRIDSLYVNAIWPVIGIVSEPNVAVSVDQRDNLKQLAVVCSAD
jgi:hypothetical protein